MRLSKVKNFPKAPSFKCKNQHLNQALSIQRHLDGGARGGGGGVHRE